jgi:hypothetical protein
VRRELRRAANKEGLDGFIISPRLDLDDRVRCLARISYAQTDREDDTRFLPRSVDREAVASPSGCERNLEAPVILPDGVTHRAPRDQGGEACGPEHRIR